MKKILKGLALASLGVVILATSAVHVAKTENLAIVPGQQAMRAIYDYLSDSKGEFRIDGPNGFFVFGGTAPAVSATVTSSGTLVVESTTSTSGHIVFNVFNKARASIMSLTQGGAFAFGSGVTLSFPVGSIIGPNIAASTIPLSALSASGATDTNFIQWSAAASQWLAQPISNVFPPLSSSQTFTSGVTSYTPPALARELIWEGLGAGGGGGGASANAGTRGGSTWLVNGVSGAGVVSSTGGAGGDAGGAATVGAAGEAAGFGTCDLRIAGGSGSPSSSGLGLYFSGPGGSGAPPLGGGGPPTVSGTGAGVNGLVNSGAGGGPGVSQGTTQTGGSGAGGSYCRLTIRPPFAASYLIYVGPLGAKGAAGTQAGGDSGSGLAIMTAHF